MNTFTIGSSVLIKRSNMGEGYVLATIIQIDISNHRLLVRWSDEFELHFAEKWIYFEDVLFFKSSNAYKM